MSSTGKGKSKSKGQSWDNAIDMDDPADIAEGIKQGSASISEASKMALAAAAAAKRKVAAEKNIRKHVEKQLADERKKVANLLKDVEREKERSDDSFEQLKTLKSELKGLKGELKATKSEADKAAKARKSLWEAD